MPKTTPAALSSQDAATYLEAVIAAILAARAIGIESPTPKQMIDFHKEMLQQLRAAGGPFN